MEDIRFGEIVYNPAAGAFEARVDIQRGGTTFRYPCQVHGPLTMERGQVRHRLAAHAQRMSDSSGLHSRM